MSGHYHKVKHQRMKKSTHFQEVNVTMQPLNDPILPKHPGSPDPSLKSRSDKSLFHNIDLSEIVVSGRPSTRTSDRHGNRDSNVYRSSRSETTKSAPSLYPHSASNNEYESHSPYSKSQLDEFEELPVKFALSQSNYFKIIMFLRLIKTFTQALAFDIRGCFLCFFRNSSLVAGGR